MRIEIETNYDTHYCDTCGNNWADGGVVRVDGVEVLRRDPHAHCYNGTSYNVDELLVMALDKLGHTVMVDGGKYHVCCHDDEYHKDESE